MPDLPPQMSQQTVSRNGTAIDAQVRATCSHPDAQQSQDIAPTDELADLLWRVGGGCVPGEADPAATSRSVAALPGCLADGAAAKSDTVVLLRSELRTGGATNGSSAGDCQKLGASLIGVPERVAGGCAVAVVPVSKTSDGIRCVAAASGSLPGSLPGPLPGSLRSPLPNPLPIPLPIPLSSPAPGRRDERHLGHGAPW